MDKKDSTQEYGHPAKLWPSRWLFHDRSDQSVEFQMMDALYDIRTILTIWFALWIIW